MSGIGGVSPWREAAEFILLGCGTVQVCTAAMHYGYRIVEDMIDGLSKWMDENGCANIAACRGLSLPKVTEWKHLDLNYKIVARINHDKCIGCDLCYVACWDGAHQCIHIDGGFDTHPRPSELIEATSRSSAVTPIPNLDGAASNNARRHVPRVDEDECVGCNLCWLVCPVDGCIRMEEIPTGLPPESWEQRCQATLRPPPG